jgi:hypothetical protein
MVAAQKDAAGRVFPTVVNRVSLARFTGSTFSGNQYSEATISARNGSTVEGVAVRIQSNTNGSGYALLDYYGAFYTIVRIGDTGSSLRIVQASDSLNGGRLKDFAVKPATGDVIRLEVSGSPTPTLTAYRNGVLLGSVVDTGTSDWTGTYPPLSGGQPGFLMFTSISPASSVQLSEWKGGDLLSGTVTFRTGNTVLATVSVEPNGQATFTTSSLTAGLHAVTAEYSGDVSFNGSVSSTVIQAVNAGFD